MNDDGKNELLNPYRMDKLFSLQNSYWPETFIELYRMGEYSYAILMSRDGKEICFRISKKELKEVIAGFVSGM